MNAARTTLTVRNLLHAAVLAGALALTAAPAHAASSRQTFETPEAAMAAFGDAVAINDERFETRGEVKARRRDRPPHLPGDLPSR